jgi:hypothetical protein
MLHRKYILLTDAIINLILGLLLLLYSENLAIFLGAPVVENYFYPNILGGVFIGISIALYIELKGFDSPRTNGLGLLGAVTINLCGGIVLLFWLLFGELEIPVKGKILLWLIDVLLILLSGIEFLNHVRKNE